MQNGRRQAASSCPASANAWRALLNSWARGAVCWPSSFLTFAWKWPTQASTKSSQNWPPAKANDDLGAAGGAVAEHPAMATNAKTLAQQRKTVLQAAYIGILDLQVTQIGLVCP